MTTLDLSANRLGDASAADLAEIVRRNSNALRSLCLARNEFSAAGIRTLADALGDNTSIQVCTCTGRRQTPRLPVYALAAVDMTILQFCV